MTLKAIIIDDERLARKELRSLLAEREDITVAGEAEDIAGALDLIETGKPDVVFLDIQLSNENGFDLLEKTEAAFKLIFVTAFDEFAIRAFEINALDYLLKPVNPARLENAIERLFEDSASSPESNARKLEIDDRLFVEENGRSRFILVSEISHICASGDYTEIYTARRNPVLIERPLREWQARLPAKHFTRIHRSTIINLNEVERIESLFNRTMEVSLRSRTEPFTVSRRYAARLKEKFG